MVSRFNSGISIGSSGSKMYPTRQRPWHLQAIPLAVADRQPNDDRLYCRLGKSRLRASIRLYVQFGCRMYHY